MSELHALTRDRFLRALRDYARTDGLPPPVVLKSRGKGGHVTIRFNGALTVAQSGDAQHMWAVWLKQLGLPKDAF